MKLPIILSLFITLTFSAGANENTDKNSETSDTISSRINQDTWYYNYSEQFDQPTQTSLLFNFSRENVKGSQISIFTNFANKNVKNIQLAWGVNHTNKQVDGAQISGILNIAHQVDGFQLAGEINFAKKVDGWQVANINMADTIKGVQLGLFNFANHIDGSTIGFFNYSKNGLLHLDILTSESGMNMLKFATGKTFFTSYTLGYTFDSETNPYRIGMGFGYHKDMNKLFFEGEFNGSLILDNQTKWSKVEDLCDNSQKHCKEIRHNSLYSLSARLGWELFSNLSLFGGLNYNWLDTDEHGPLMNPWSDRMTADYNDFHSWPGFELGVRIGR
ncbi:MAG: hypothetical protein HQK83_09065 [Fibrobacteria bacterium]|nr:hypothetical protein [Fibrobacteria bacterium]